MDPAGTRDPRARPGTAVPMFVPALLGAALLLVPAATYRIDLLAEDCARWPPVGRNLLLSAAYLGAVALLTLGWVRAFRLEGLRTGTVLALGLVVHLVPLLAAPFLSTDGLFYVAVGRVVARGGDPLHALRLALPVDDDVLRRMTPAWRDGSSAYAAGFHALLRALVAVAGGGLTATLHLLQLVAALAMVGAAALTARAARALGRDPARAAALVLFCPLAVVEASANAHNDALLALVLAGAVWALAVRRPLVALALLAAGLLVKASGLVALGVVAVALLGQALAARRRLSASAARALLVVAGLLAAAAVAVVIALRDRAPALHAIASLIGWTGEPYPHCTRSVECLPRSFLHLVVGLPAAGFAVAALFRVLAALWLLGAGARAGARGASDGPSALVAGLGTALFVYYLGLHGYMQSWYLLSLLPLVPFADRRVVPALATFLIASTTYYALQLPLQCMPTPVPTALKEFFEAAICILPASFVLLASLRRARRANAG